MASFAFINAFGIVLIQKLFLLFKFPPCTCFYFKADTRRTRPLHVYFSYQMQYSEIKTPPIPSSIFFTTKVEKNNKIKLATEGVYVYKIRLYLSS